MKIIIELETIEELVALRTVLGGATPGEDRMEQVRVGLKADTDALVAARDTVEQDTPHLTKE